jgi:hypothetical protein
MHFLYVGGTSGRRANSRRCRHSMERVEVHTDADHAGSAPKTRRHSPSEMIVTFRLPPGRASSSRKFRPSAREKPSAVRKSDVTPRAGTSSMPAPVAKAIVLF